MRIEYIDKDNVRVLRICQKIRKIETDNNNNDQIS